MMMPSALCQTECLAKRPHPHLHPSPFGIEACWFPISLIKSHRDFQRTHRIPSKSLGRRKHIELQISSDSVDAPIDRGDSSAENTIRCLAERPCRLHTESPLDESRQSASAPRSRFDLEDNGFAEEFCMPASITKFLRAAETALRRRT